MATKIPEGDETEMNMTPMIDIVFQLIIFFLLSLKFKSVDRRIESALPKDRGIQATQQFVDEIPMVTVKLFRRGTEDENPDNDFTRIRVGNSFTIELPEGEWDGTMEGDAKRQEEYDEKFAEITRAIKDLWSRMGNNPDAKGEIKTPPPFGLKVPHGDVMRVLESFIQAELTDVKFEGAPPPMPTAGGGGFATQGG